MTDEWAHELNKHPFISSKSLIIDLYRISRESFIFDERGEQISKDKEESRLSLNIKLDDEMKEDDPMNINYKRLRKDKDNDQKSLSSSKDQRKKLK